ncbi:hypothetical protein ZWY2020_052042 [Hordeum vulgare]|nr:hypothetical protein ZWY2020_052042 [Hordeum vulgare]
MESKTVEQQVKAELGEEKALPSSSITPQDAAVDPPAPDKGLNRRIVVLTTLAAVGLFGFQRLQLGGFSLKHLAANAMPYEESTIVSAVLEPDGCVVWRVWRAVRRACSADERGV